MFIVLGLKKMANKSSFILFSFYLFFSLLYFTFFLFFFIFFVVRYTSNIKEREEGGTPGILGDVKLGLAVLLKQSFGEEANYHT